MSNGFWKKKYKRERLLNKQISWEFLENESKSEGFSAYDFLHGYCNAFAVALNEIYGYECYSLYDEDDNFIHSFCSVDGAWLDIRGITTDMEAFLAEFKQGGKKLTIKKSKDCPYLSKENFGFYANLALGLSTQIIRELDYWTYNQLIYQIKMFPGNNIPEILKNRENTLENERI